MSTSRSEPNPIPGAAEILKISSQGDQDLKFTLKFRVMPYLDYYDPIGVLYACDM